MFTFAPTCTAEAFVACISSPPPPSTSHALFVMGMGPLESHGEFDPGSG